MSQVMESEEFMLLPANQLIDIISSDELNVRSEEQVFNAVMAWVKYSIQERRPQLPQVSWRNMHQFWFRYMMEYPKRPLLCDVTGSMGSAGAAACPFATPQPQVPGGHRWVRPSH